MNTYTRSSEVTWYDCEESFRFGSHEWNVQKAKAFIRSTDRPVESMEISDVAKLVGTPERMIALGVAISWATARTADLSIPVILAPFQGSYIPIDGGEHPHAGHCYVASEALWHLLGGQRSGYVPQFLRWENSPHWYLRHTSTGEILDATAGQFLTSPSYALGRGKGFLTSTPSKRAIALMSRVMRAQIALAAPWAVDHVRGAHGTRSPAIRKRSAS